MKVQKPIFLSMIKDTEKKMRAPRSKSHQANNFLEILNIPGKYKKL